jgi:hypothetical protein
MSSSCPTWISICEVYKVYSTEIRSTGHHSAVNALAARLGGFFCSPYLLSGKLKFRYLSVLMIIVHIAIALSAFSP